MRRAAALALVAVLSASVALVGSGCGGVNYELHYRGMSQLNERDGQSRAVQVRVFFLKSDAAFNAASDDELSKGGSNDVIRDLVDGWAVREFQVLPQTAWKLDEVADCGLPADVAFIGVFAQFTTNEIGQRRALIPVTQLPAWLTLEGNSLQLASGAQPQ